MFNWMQYIFKISKPVLCVFMTNYQKNYLCFSGMELWVDLMQYIDSVRVNSPQIILTRKQIRMLEMGKRNIEGIYHGITNGGLYLALMNMNISVFTRKPGQNAMFWQNHKIDGLKIALKNLYYNLKRIKQEKLNSQH